MAGTFRYKVGGNYNGSGDGNIVDAGGLFADRFNGATTLSVGSVEASVPDSIVNVTNGLVYFGYLGSFVSGNEARIDNAGYLFDWTGQAIAVAFAGGSFGDDLFGGSGADTLLGGGGDDDLRGGAGNDMLSGGAGQADRAFFSGQYAQYQITKGASGQVIDLRAGSPDGTDSFSGLESFVFSDAVLTYAFNGFLLNTETLLYNDGRRIVVDYDETNADPEIASVTSLFDSAGTFDFARFARNDGTAALMIGGAGANTLIGDGAANVVAAGEGNDLVLGLGGNDWLEGQGGQDALVGGAGNDRLDGGTGSDWLQGGPGYDLLIGGAGSDVFEFRAFDINPGNWATIADLGSSADDYDGVLLVGFADRAAFYQDGANTLIYDTALGLTGGIIVQNITVADLQGHLGFA